MFSQVHWQQKKKSMDANVVWELTSPFTFGKVLEYWVQQYCEICGRGNMVCVYGQTVSQSSLGGMKIWASGRGVSSSTPITACLQPQQDKLQQLHSCWNGVFCGECGRGGFALPPPPPNANQQPSPAAAAEKGPAVAAMVGYISKSVLHQVLRDWVLGHCSGCKREGQPNLRRATHLPMPLAVVLDAWRGRQCQICGRGSVPPVDTQPTSSLSCPTPHRKKLPPQRHEPYKRPDVKQHRSGLVERYLQRKKRY